jgi:hypothetical protein
MFNQIFTYQANLSGPGVTTALGGNKKVGVQVANFPADQHQQFPCGSGAAIFRRAQQLHRAGGIELDAPQEWLCPEDRPWDLAPDGTIQGPTGLSNQGVPFWTFAPRR